ncbi:MAG: transcription antitermination factor NusB [Gammaproteobacteria bacterium]
MSAGESAGRELFAARRKARHYAVQALYQWAVSATSPAEIERQFLEEFDFSGADQAYFHDILHGVPEHLQAIEASFSPFLDIPLERLGPVERAVLRMAGWELLERIEVPWRVVLDEAITLTRKFGATDSHRFVNAVLDRLARELRPAETRARR